MTRRRVGFGLLFLVVTATYVGLGIEYRAEHGETGFIHIWSWYFGLGLSLIATGGLSAYFYVVSTDLPAALHRQMLVLVKQLQCPIKGYREVTQHIIDVCASATSHYYAATLMPLIGAVGEAEFYQSYRENLLSKLNRRCRVELVFLEDEPLEKFMRSVLRDEELAEQRIALVKSFITEMLEPMSCNPEYRDYLLLKRTNFIPYQVSIADGVKAVLYFGQVLDMKHESSVRAFYTEDRAVIEVLNMGFEAMREAAQPALPAPAT